MINYQIRTSSSEETEMVKRVLDANNIEYRFDKGITCYGFLSFNVKKEIWKKIKKELNLKVTSKFYDVIYE